MSSLIPSQTCSPLLAKRFLTRCCHRAEKQAPEPTCDTTDQGSMYPQAPQRDILHNRCVELHTSRSGSLTLIISCRFVLSSGPRSCLYCHFSGTKGHFISFASSRRVLKSSGSKAEKVKEQVKIPQWVSTATLTTEHGACKKHTSPPSQTFSKLIPALNSCHQPSSGMKVSSPVICHPWLLCPPGKWEPSAIKKAFSRKSPRLVAGWA